MDIEALNEILRMTTAPLRKARPKIDDTPEASKFEIIDCHLIDVGVHKVAAEAYRDQLVGQLDSCPEPERLAGGPNYIEMGGLVGDQTAALQLFALGKFLGLWEIVTPKDLAPHSDPESQDEMARNGFVMITCYPSQTHKITP